MSRPATIAAVLVAGMAIALVLSTRQDATRGHDTTVEAVAAPIAVIRREAWTSIPAAAESTLRDRIVTRLAAPDTTEAALADAARGFHERSWRIESTHAIAAGELGDGEVFVAWFAEAWPADPDLLERSADAIHAVLALDTPSASRLLDLLLRAPETSIADVGAVLDGSTDTSTPVQLALGRRGRRPEAVETRVDAARRLLADPATDDPRVLERAPVWTLAAAGDAARAALAARATSGDPEAARAIALADPDRVIRGERPVLADHEFPFERRALAAFRLLDREAPPGDAAILNLLDDGPADRDGTVHAAALLADRGLSSTAAERLAERWRSSSLDDQRRAGIMLTAVRHARGIQASPSAIEMIDRLSIDADAAPRLRRTARHAARVLDRWPHDDLDPTVYAARTTRLDDGRLDPDAVLLGILAGDANASRRLGASPRLDEVAERAPALASAIAWRRTILAALAPTRLAAIGEPIPGDEDDLRLWIDAIEADRLVRGPISPDANRFAQPTPPGDTLLP